MEIKCPKCQSAKVRSIDNQPLWHPTEDEIRDGASVIDFEIYLSMRCECGHTFEMVCDIVPTRIS